MENTNVTNVMEYDLIPDFFFLRVYSPRFRYHDFRVSFIELCIVFAVQIRAVRHVYTTHRVRQYVHESRCCCARCCSLYSTAIGETRPRSSIFFFFFFWGNDLIKFFPRVTRGAAMYEHNNKKKNQMVFFSFFSVLHS